MQAANVLNSQIASKMSVFIIRAFLRLREMALNNEKLARKVGQLESRVSDHDEILLDLINEIKKIVDTPKLRKKNAAGFISATTPRKKK